MSDAEKTYADQVAPEPLYRDDVPNTAENVLRWVAVHGLRAEVKMWDHLPPAPDEPDYEVKRLRWLVLFFQVTGAFNLHLALSELRKANPAAADEAADWVVGAYEGGDAYGEWLHQWTSEAGIDADRIVAEVKAEATA